MPLTTAWTEVEQALLREHYRRRGVRWCMERLPGRTKGAIMRQASTLAVTTPKADLSRPSTPWIDAAIRRAYANCAERSITAFAASIGRSPQWVSHRAGELGLTARRLDRRPFSEAEIAFIRSHAGLTRHSIAIAMRRHGWRRTPAAIDGVIKRLAVQLPEDDGKFSTGDVALSLGVNTSTVLAWMAKGLLSAKLVSTVAAHGKVYRIEETDVARFIVENPTLIDMRKDDGVWLIDLLARRGAAAQSKVHGKREKILALSEARPDLDRSAVAAAMDVSPAYVSSVRTKAKAAEQAELVA